MIRTIKNVSKIAIFDNSSKKYSMTNVISRTGCTDIVNGGFFNMSTLAPLTHLKVDGIVKTKDAYSYYGYAFNTNSKTLTLTNKYDLYDNFFCGVCMIKDGQKVTMYYNSDVGGSRGRSAIGVMKDGTIVMYCTKDGTSENKTPEQLQEYFLKLGVDSAIMLDGGGSSQGSFNGTKATSTRVVSNFITIWEKDDSGKTEDTSSEDSKEEEVSPLVITPDPDPSAIVGWDCGYEEPTSNIQSGSTGIGAKWVQSMLRKIGFLIAVDGDFGSESVTALKSFQKYWSLSSDEICGQDTRKALNKCTFGIENSDREVIKTAMPEICRTERAKQDDKYINWYNAATGAEFATTVAWCAIFVSWVLRRSGIDEATYPNFASCSSGSSVFANKGVLRDPSSYSPKSGDIVFFDFDGNKSPEHVGIVFINDGNNIETIEGNSSDAVKHNVYSLKSSSIYKYVEIM